LNIQEIILNIFWLYSTCISYRNRSSLKVLKIYISLIGPRVSLDTESSFSSIHYTLFFISHTAFFIRLFPQIRLVFFDAAGFFIEPRSIHYRPFSKCPPYSPVYLLQPHLENLPRVCTTEILQGIKIPRKVSRFSVAPL